ALLSGGLDSTITATLANTRISGLRTYCAGARGEERDDFAFAAAVAELLGTTHREAVIDEAGFAARWRWMVERQGVPLSTPNEVAIHEVASALRADGCVVTISGEGADELFAGYEGPMDAVWQAVSSGVEDGGGFQLISNAWVRSDAKATLLSAEWLTRIERDDWLVQHYREVFRECAAASGPGVAAHLRMLQRINLAGLLQRLDSATMLASVEGRTPFADVEVAALARRMTIEAMYASPEEAPDAAVRTKLALRSAFADMVPRAVLLRPKASFPLPFRGWMQEVGTEVRRSDFVRSLVRPEVLETVTADPGTNWWLAWPLFNLALWSSVLS
ncbi:MAG: asparagine synthase, partial [Phycisphaerales bacterium]|nr:asparagine synthase [Phycisphaerales bacterium]